MSSPPAAWRVTAADFVEVGRTLGEIEMNLRRIKATAVVDNRQAEIAVYEMRIAANKMSKYLDKIMRSDGFGIRDGEST